MGGVYISLLRSLQYFTSACPFFVFVFLIRLLPFPETEGCISSCPFSFLPPKTGPHVRELTDPFADTRVPLRGEPLENATDGRGQS